MTHKLYSEIDDQTTLGKKAPLIYIIEYGEGENYRVYIGKASSGVSRPMKTYLKCVENYETGKLRTTYRRVDGKWEPVGKRNAWREHIHPALSRARKAGVPIKLTMFNVSASELDATEDQMIKDAFHKYGGEHVLNKLGLPK